MERWLSKPVVLVLLCGVLLVAALNRQDPTVYAMFLFLAVTTVLGLLLPWLSLRSTTVRLEAGTDLEAMEGTDSGITLLLDHKAPWPAFLVDVETEWAWGVRRFVLKQTVSVIRAGRVPDLGRWIRFPCRGHYELLAVRLSSGFPLGLVRARHTVLRPQIHLRVLPQAQPVQWPLPWDTAQSPQAERATRRTGPSFEPGTLRAYQPGDPVGRVHWRASARLGSLVVQQYQQSGSPLLRVAVEVPRGTQWGDAAGAGEQAIRLAAGVCHAALAQCAQLFLYLEHLTQPVCGASAIDSALAEAQPGAGGFFPVLARMADATKQGEQLAVVVSSTCPASTLVRALSAFSARGCRMLVCIAVGRRQLSGELAQVGALQSALQQAGFNTLVQTP